MGRDDRPTKGERDTRDQGSTGGLPGQPAGGAPGQQRSFGQGSDGGGSERDLGIDQDRDRRARAPGRLHGEQRRDR